MIPAVLAIVGGCFLAVLLSLPFVVVSYRRRGELGFGRILLAVGFVIYALAIATYTLLPLPELTDAWCARHEAFRTPQLNVTQFIVDIRTEQRVPGLRGYLHNPAVQQSVFNIALFVPLGMYLRQFFGRGVLTSIAIGFGVSLLVELTQLTGNWFLFPCPYRIFDVDDLIANTLGTAVGVLLAPMLRPFAGRTPSAPPTEPRPVTAWRRLLGMVMDLVSVYLLGTFISVVVDAVVVYVFHGQSVQRHWLGSALVLWLPAFLLLVLPSLGRQAATIGQRAVRLRRIRPDGRPAGARVVIALLTGGAGYFACMGLSSTDSVFGTIGFGLLAGAFVLVWPRSHRGMSGLLSGLVIADSREKADVSDRPVSTSSL
ncbi:hypothetical protein ALI144C_18290 [Actinosynnema sp. ALI-1.44]|nr:hypothetical protein ALI144C_18290 [Actinosynnema sp. ALI-1.44]